MLEIKDGYRYWPFRIVATQMKGVQYNRRQERNFTEGTRKLVAYRELGKKSGASGDFCSVNCNAKSRVTRFIRPSQ